MILLLLGCWNDAKIQTLLDAHAKAINVVSAQLVEIETLQQSRHSSGDGAYTYDGELDGQGQFGGGTALVTGSGTSQSNGYWLTDQLVITWQDVTVDGVFLDGVATVQVDSSLVDTTVTLRHIVYAEALSVGGEVPEDSVDLDTTMVAIYAGADTTVRWDGVALGEELPL